MTARKSGLTEDSLQSCLSAFRKIAATPNENEALEATDNVVSQIVNGMRDAGILDAVPDVPLNHGESGLDDWKLHSAEEQLEQIERTAERLEAALAVPEGLQAWDAVGLRDSVDRLEQFVDAKVRQRLATRLGKARQRAHEVANRVEVSCLRMTIQDAGTQVLHSVSSVTSILASVDDAIAALVKHGALSQEMAQAGHDAKARAARYRCDKKLAEAEVAFAGGNEKRAEKLRREASVMLAQDWVRAFPGEHPPAS